MSYYRNNVQHVFALPSLFAYALHNHRGINRASLITLIEAVYPYLKGELFLKSTSNEITKVANDTLDWLLSRGLLLQQANTIRGARNGSRDQVKLRLLAAICAPIIERFYIVISLISAAGSGTKTTEQLESQSVEFAERLSLINGLHSPEYFDKRLFKGFIAALIENSVIQCKDDTISYDDALNEIQVLAEKVMNNEIVHNLLLANVEHS